MNEDTPNNPGNPSNYNETYQRMFTQISGSAGHGDGHHVIPPYRMAPYSLNSGFPTNAPVLPPTSATRHILQPQPQQAHWVLSTNADQPSSLQSQSQQHQQLQQQQNNAQFQRLKVEDALSYLDKVKAQFGGQPQVYNDFLDIMKEFKSQAIDTPVVISRVSHLFAGQKELIVGFNTFLPPGFKIIEEGSSQTLNLCQPGHQAVPIASLGTGSNNSQFRSSEPSLVRPVPAPSGALVPQHQSHLGPQLQTPPGQPVEFNHAINYVNKIKMYYHGRPEIYKAFLDILHNYQKEQKNIKESSKGHSSSKSTVTEADVYAQVANLFQDNPELLLEFRQFLPDANGNASLINGLGAAESALRAGAAGAGGGGGATASATMAGISGEMTGRTPDHMSAKNLNSVTHRSQSLSSGYGMPSSRKRKLSREPTLIPVKTEAMLSDREYFDQLKKTSDPLYKEMFKCIDLYNAGSISAEDLLDMTGPLIGKTPEVKSRLMSMLASDRKVAAEKKDKDFQWHLDLSSCKRYDDQPSYRVLPKKKVVPKPESKSVIGPKDALNCLNEEYAVFADPDIRSEASIWQCAKHSMYEDSVFQVEDERYELDMILQPHYDVMNGLNEVHKMLQKMPADEQARFQMNELSSFCHMAEVHIQRVLKKLYNNKWDTVYEGLKKIPSVAVGLVLNRMQEKCTEWEENKKKFNQSWQESSLKNRIKHLELQSAKIKHADGKQLKPRTLIKEVEDLAKARESLADEPLMTLLVQDPAVIEDAVQLITIVSKRQSGVCSEEMRRLKLILKSLVKDLLHVTSIKEELETEEGCVPEDRKDSAKDKNVFTKLSRERAASRRGGSLERHEYSPSEDDDVVTAFYCSDNWYVLFRIFVVLCDRLAFFVKHTEELVDDDRKDFSQMWPASVSAALEQHMQEHGHTRRSYATFLWLSQNMLNGVIDASIYEELIRETFGMEAYVAFTIEKLVLAILRHIASSSDCMDLLKLFEKHQKSHRPLDSKSMDEYLMEAQSIIGEDENSYLIKSFKKGNKGRMAVWLLPKVECCLSKPMPEENPLTKDWRSSSPSIEEQPMNIQTTSESLPTKVHQNFPDFDADAAFETNGMLSKSAPAILWSSTAHTAKSPIFVQRNFSKAVKYRLHLNRVKGMKQMPVKPDLIEDEDEEEEEEVDEELCPVKSLMEKLNEKEFLLMRLTSLVKAKQTHMQLTQKKYSRFRKLLDDWKNKNVTDKEEETCLDWFNGKAEEMHCKTVCCTVDSCSQLPYRSYTKYTVQRVDNTNIGVDQVG